MQHDQPVHGYRRMIPTGIAVKTWLTRFERLQIGTKLVIGFSAGIVIALVVGVYGLWGLDKLQSEMESMYEYDLLGVSHIKEANLNLIYMSRAMRHALIAQDEPTRSAAIDAVRRSRETLMTELAESRKRMFRAETISRYDAFQGELTAALSGIEQAVSMIQKEGILVSNAATFITSPDFAATIAAADGGLHDLTAIKQKAAYLTLERVRAQSSRARELAITLLVVGVVAAGLLGTLIGMSVRRPNQRLRVAVEALAAGKVDAAIPHTEYTNEVGAMARSVQVLQEIYLESEELHWVKSRVAEVSNGLQQAEDFRGLAQSAISKIAPTIGAGHGAFYVIDGEGAFQLFASYGYRERKRLNNRFRPGEGLIGQCAMERSTIQLITPPDYIRIGSGLGEGAPTCVMVLPIIHGARVLGVLELASFGQFKERDKALLDALLPVLATSMEILDRNLKTKELLVATQEQAERMERQAARLEEQSVEMEAQKAELLETESWYHSIIESAPDGMMVADADGLILLANPAVESIFGYQQGELRGAHIEQLVPRSVRPPHVSQRGEFMEKNQARRLRVNGRVHGLRKDGSEVPLEISLAPLPPRGSRGKCVCDLPRRMKNPPTAAIAAIAIQSKVIAIPSAGAAGSPGQVTLYPVENYDMERGNLSSPGKLDYFALRNQNGSNMVPQKPGHLRGVRPLGDTP